MHIPMVATHPSQCTILTYYTDYSTFCTVSIHTNTLVLYIHTHAVFLCLTEKSNSIQQIIAMREVLADMPYHNKLMLGWLMVHMSHIVKHVSHLPCQLYVVDIVGCILNVIKGRLCVNSCYFIKY